MYPEIENDMVHRLYSKETKNVGVKTAIFITSLIWLGILVMFTYWVVSNLS